MIVFGVLWLLALAASIWWTPLPRRVIPCQYVPAVNDDPAELWTRARAAGRTSPY
jgi:hypothetical protein